MRKIVLLEHISLDGYMAGPHGEMDWIPFDEDMAAFGHEATDRCDAVIYGRKTYELMAGYWPTAADQPGASDHDRSHSAWVNAAEKFVVSRSLQSAPWGHSGDCAVVGDIQQFTAIKDRPGKHIVLIGSIDTARAMIEAELVDEYYLTVNPAILGNGRRLFGDLKNRTDLALADARTLATGVVACHYVLA